MFRNGCSFIGVFWVHVCGCVDKCQRNFLLPGVPGGVCVCVCMNVYMSVCVCVHAHVSNHTLWEETPWEHTGLETQVGQGGQRG